MSARFVDNDFAHIFHVVVGLAGMEQREAVRNRFFSQLLAADHRDRGEDTHILRERR